MDLRRLPGLASSEMPWPLALPSPETRALRRWRALALGLALASLTLVAFLAVGPGPREGASAVDDALWEARRPVLRSALRAGHDPARELALNRLCRLALEHDDDGGDATLCFGLYLLSRWRRLAPALRAEVASLPAESFPITRRILPVLEP